ncbi:hypothetical protein [Blattabacterium cuenoti]|uniref:Uncharacterized protein n=1 Tax=Blattabacterium cuenoti BPAA TaxID=1229512 RepID=M4ZSG6_9FLAO|nr:hypothetical protein [Blattabacterium cuenoti]BAM99446.1 hypothetical protein BPAA_149 [Blattabacterium cuenoti BPAA]
MTKNQPIVKKNILGIHPKRLINLNKYSIKNILVFFHTDFFHTDFFHTENMKINIFIF